MNYSQRKEIMESIKYVDQVIPSKWIITNQFLEKHKIDFLVHGSDNNNYVDKEKLIIFRRTKGVSAFDIRNIIKQSK